MKRYRRTRKRARTTDTYQLLSWADNYGTDCAQAINSYRNRRQLTDLHDASSAAVSLIAIIDELEARRRESW